MKHRLLIYISIVFVVFGGILTVTGIALGANGAITWDHGIKIVTFNEEKTISEHNIPGVKSIKITTVNTDIAIKSGESWGIEAVVHDADLTWVVENGLLEISSKRTGVLFLSTFNFGSSNKQNQITITVPEDIVTLTAETTSGDILISAITSQTAVIRSVSGDIAVTGSTLRGTVKTTSGDIDITKGLFGGQVSTVSGDINISKFESGSISCASGDVRITQAHGLSEYIGKISTVSGDITVGNNSLNKSYRFENGAYDLNITTVSGDITVS